MAVHQNTSVDSHKLIIGNFKIEVATVDTAYGGTWENLGAGIVNSFGHNITKYDVQSGNAPDPIEGVADESFVVSGELIEYDGALLASAMGGIITCGSTATYESAISGGGATTITNKAFKLTNVRTASSTSVTTTILIYKATFDTGMQFTAKSDNDTDPINVMAFNITGKNDETRTAMDQLYTIRKWLD